MAGVVIVVILAIIPIFTVTVMTYLMALPGVFLSPIAGLITWRMARNRGLDGGRYLLVGVASSVFLLLPWLLLIRALRSGVSDAWVRLTYILLFLSWLIGPIVIWGQHVAKIDFLTSLILDGGGDSQPERPFFAYGVFALMSVMWMGSAVIASQNRGSTYDVTEHDLSTLRHIAPFALAWACLLIVQGYMFFFGDIAN